MAPARVGARAPPERVRFAAALAHSVWRSPAAARAAAPPACPPALRGCDGATAGRARPRPRRAPRCCARSTPSAPRAGLPAIPADPRVQAAAAAHARDMVRRRYFAHQRAGGPSLLRRLKRAGLARSRRPARRSPTAAAASATPLATLRMWLDSPPHRAILLGRGWSAAGVGLSRGGAGQPLPRRRDLGARRRGLSGPTSRAAPPTRTRARRARRRPPSSRPGRAGRRRGRRAPRGGPSRPTARRSGA